MTIVFKKPPLVELIAELRWGAPTFGLTPGGMGAFAFPAEVGEQGQPQLQFAYATLFDSFFMRFAVEAHKMGFTIQERVIPPNAILMPYQTVWRWKKPDVPGLLLQLGSGVFTVNGGPPAYSHWDTFVPIVQEGVAGLLTALEAHPQPRPTAFSHTLLRYIDLFDSEIAAKKTPLDFFRDVLGLKIELPETMLKFQSGDQPIIPQLNLQTPLVDGVANFMFAYGIIGGRSGHILDTTVTRTTEVPLNANSVAESFTASHAITNEVFMGLTKPLHAEMEPSE
ncbi:TIGR04255 family protein [Burkholderia gladioli]|uniref:TIGR04255 family protein n=1 Tax=Burkholderia gladioli TaxID=28095 RepID=A0AB38TP09_BURGA|nr:TIGR04255 family protein [Burkholderia gladioli]MDN7604923.1 TIGR04255 family protein [Burkholderia gladioli]UWX70172.1 TIGR04255 family protein [Burkholderia gladioli]